jgi:purine-nucleoside/S-methyl-5'-thioadenosine phosphorylase / adenosine deaminase
MLCAWREPPLHHGFLGRTGGVSRGRFASLNLADRIGDDPAAVDANWRAIADLLPPDGIVARLNQVHGAVVHTIGLEYAGRRLDGDGMVTATAGITLAVFTADCVPILMVDAERRIAAALHAGWRGTLAGITGAGVQSMEALGSRPAAIRAALGPAIGSCCFEVGADLANRFAREMPAARRHTRAGRPGKAFVDLRAIVKDQLCAAGLSADRIATVGPCTRCANDQFFSRRGAGGKTCGLQMSFIGFAQR